MRSLNWLLIAVSVGLGLTVGAVAADLCHAVWGLPRPALSLTVGPLCGWLIYSGLYRLTFGSAQ